MIEETSTDVGETMARRAKKLTIDEAAKRLAAIIGEHLDRLPPTERKRRSKSAHQYVRSRVKALNGRVAPAPTPARPGRTAPTRVAARSAR